LTKSDIAKRFGKAAILSIAKDELGIDINPSEHIYAVIEKIVADIEEQGVPDSSECNDDLFDLLIALGYIDEDGNPIEEGSEPETKQKGDVELPDTLPGCWSRGEMDNSACRNCKILQPCLEAREKNKKNRVCFGVLYKEADENCRICLDWKDCREQSANITGKN
jgi:hypothetical protein